MCVFLGYRPMHKGYKCLDKSTGRIYISHDIVFDETVFPFANPGVFVDVTTLEESITFPTDEPVTSTPMRNYDLTFLSTNDPVSDALFPQEPSVPDRASDVPPASPIDVHGAAMHGSQPRAASTSPAPGPSPSGASPAPAATSMAPVAQASPIASPPVHQEKLVPPTADPSATVLSAAPPPDVDDSTHAMVPRACDNTRKEKVYTDGTVCYDPR